jgi:hypothetical protein
MPQVFLRLLRVRRERPRSVSFSSSSRLRPTGRVLVFSDEERLSPKTGLRDAHGGGST